METTMDNRKIEAFRGGLKGDAYAPGDEGYGAASAAWNLNAR